MGHVKRKEWYIMAPKAVEMLRAVALAELVHLQPVRIRGRKELYRCKDGSIFLLRTAPKGTLMTKAHGPNAGDRMRIEDGPHQSVVIATPARNGASIEVYRVPKGRVVADLNKQHRHFCESHTPASATNLRAIAFGGEKDSNGRGFRIRYREFLIQSDQAAASSSRSGSEEAPVDLRAPSGPARGLLDMAEVSALRARLSREFGVQPMEIGIRIEVCGGRLAFQV